MLTRPEDPSFFNDVESDLIEIAELVDVNHGYSEISAVSVSDLEKICGTEVASRIRRHLYDFDWLRTESFYGFLPYTIEDAIEHLREILDTGIDDARKENETWKRNHEEKLSVIKRYDFDQETVALANLSSFCAKWQDMRKVNTLKITALHSRYLTELSRRSGIEEDMIAYLDVWEVESFIKGAIPESELIRRRAGSLYVYSKKGLSIYVDDDAKKFYSRVIEKEVSGIREVTGKTASPGLATGTVKIVVGAADIEKVEEGDVLVASMTRPEHVLGMKRAGSIVTDDGGITCHAAIVSRELGIPCVIGTKYATKVFTDGDRVEVDANNGVVRLID